MTSANRFMPSLAILAFLLALSLTGCAEDPSGPKDGDPCSVWCDSCCNVLMIGNSLTAFYDTPGIIQELADSSGVEMDVEIALYLGHTLKMIVEKTDVFERIKKGKWDYVVIQGSSYYIAFPEYHDLILPPIEALADSILDNEPCTKIVFFMDWCLRDGIDIDGEHLTFHEFTMMIRDGTLALAGDMGFIVAPLGVAWDVVLAAHPEIVLHDEDGGHPGPKGSYLNACVYYSVFTKRSSVGIPVLRGLPPGEVSLFQDVASSTVLDSLETWNIQ